MKDKKNVDKDAMADMLKEMLKKVSGGKDAIAIRAGSELFSKANEIEAIVAIVARGEKITFDEKLDIKNRLHNFIEHQKRILDEADLPYTETPEGLSFKAPLSFVFAMDYFKEVRIDAMKILGLQIIMPLENIVEEIENFIKNILLKNGYDLDDKDIFDKLSEKIEEIKLRAQENKTKENKEKQEKDIVN